MNPRFVCVICVAVVPCLHAAFAAESAITAKSVPAAESRNKPVELRASTEAPLDERNARDWGLTIAEWTRYRELMRGPLGIRSPNLDPLTALGIEARSPEERRRIAELQVRFEAYRTERLLAYQREYDDAWQRLYPRLKPVASTTSTIASGTSKLTANEDQGPSRLAVFVRDACASCDQMIKQLESQGRGFDVYVVGSEGDDAKIRGWARRVGISSAKVRSGVITLNHDAGRWFALGERGPLPAALRKVNGSWRRE